MDTNIQSSISVRRLARWLLMILLLAIIAMGWKWANTQGYIARFQQTLTQYLVDADILGTRTRQMLAQVESALIETDQQLNQLTASLPSINNQKQALTQSDIEAITNEETYQNIGRYAEQIDQLPLAMHAYLVPLEFPAAKLGITGSGFWSRFFTDIWQDLRQLIQIKKLSNETIALLSPSQIQLLHGNVKLQLKQAQLALLTRDQAAFVQTVETALSLIDGHFELQQPAVIEIQAELKRYQEMAKEMASTDSGASLQALQFTQIKF